MNYRYSDFTKAMSPLSESYSKILRNREPHYIEPYEDGLRVKNYNILQRNNDNL